MQGNKTFSKAYNFINIPHQWGTSLCFGSFSTNKINHRNSSYFLQMTALIFNTHKACFQVPAPAVVQKSYNQSTQEVTNQDGKIRHLDVRNSEFNKFLKRNNWILKCLELCFPYYNTYLHLMGAYILHL